VKYQQSLTHTLSLDEIRHRQLPSFCIHNRHQFFKQLIDRWSQCVQDQLAQHSISTHFSWSLRGRHAGHR